MGTGDDKVTECDGSSSEREALPPSTTGTHSPLSLPPCRYEGSDMTWNDSTLHCNSGGHCPSRDGPHGT